MFVAVQPPDDVLDHLDDFLDARRDAADFRWTLREHLHVTLAFLAEVQDRARDDLEARLERAAKRRTAFAATLAGGGAFPNVARARVLWAGVDLSDPARTEIARLATGARAAASKAGVAVDGARFTPHVTVARLRHPRETTSWVRLLDTYRGPEWTVESVHLVASFLGEGPGNRPRYETVASYQLLTQASTRSSAYAHGDPVKIAVADETRDGEARVAMVPELVGKLTGLGYDVAVEPGAGMHALLVRRRVRRGRRDHRRRRARRRRRGRLGAAARRRPDPPAAPRDGHRVVPADRPSNRTVVVDLRDCGITAFAMELVPRISRAQSMDALSSQALVAGYRCAIVAAGMLRRFFPLNMTAAGTVQPAEVVVLGAGVAGLQAIATCQAARRGRAGVRRPRRRRRGDPLDGRQVDRPRAGDPRGGGRLRPRDDRGPRGPAAGRC